MPDLRALNFALVALAISRSAPVPAALVDMGALAVAGAYYDGVVCRFKKIDEKLKETPYKSALFYLKRKVTQIIQTNEQL